MPLEYLNLSAISLNGLNRRWGIRKMQWSLGKIVACFFGKAKPGWRPTKPSTGDTASTFQPKGKKLNMQKIALIFALRCSRFFFLNFSDSLLLLQKPVQICIPVYVAWTKAFRARNRIAHAIKDFVYSFLKKICASIKKGNGGKTNQSQLPVCIPWTQERKDGSKSGNDRDQSPKKYHWRFQYHDSTRC